MALAPLKKGSFSPDEDDKIVHNWKKFCKVSKDMKTLIKYTVTNRMQNLYKLFNLSCNFYDITVTQLE